MAIYLTRGMPRGAQSCLFHLLPLSPAPTHSLPHLLRAHFIDATDGQMEMGQLLTMGIAKS